MAKRNSGRRGRPRKRRAGGGEAAAAATAAEPVAGGSRGGGRAGEQRRGTGAKRRARAAESPRRGSVGFAQQLAALGERPQAPWHPLPLSELVIFVGIVAMVVGLARNESNHAALLVGVLAVAIGTLEFTAREHLSGYRPHTTLLAFVPTALFHAAAAIVLVALGAPSPFWAVVPVALDVPIFATLFKLLRGRFLDARRERSFRLGRS
jgi:hypothetical protein